MRKEDDNGPEPEDSEECEEDVSPGIDKDNIIQTRLSVLRATQILPTVSKMSSGSTGSSYIHRGQNDNSDYKKKQNDFSNIKI